MGVSELEELTLIIVILGSLFGVIFSAIYYKKSLNPVKRAQKRNEMSLFDNLTQYREVEKGTITDILKQKDNQIKSLNARLKQFEPNEDDQENINKINKKGVSFDEIQVLVKESYPQFSPMLPLLKKQIMEMTKGMELNEILGYVKQFTGNKQSKGNPDPQSSEYNPNWA